MLDLTSARRMALEQIRVWAEDRADIVALVLTGSEARGDSDACSDLDIEIITDDASHLASDDSWLENFGAVLVCLRLDVDVNQAWPTRLVIYKSGLKIDFTLAGRQRLLHMKHSRCLDDVYRRAYRVVLDKEGIAENLPLCVAGDYPKAALPDQRTFDLALEEFWFEALHIPKYLYRGELWLVKFRDIMLKERLLQMLRWYAVARQPQSAIDVWYLGNKMQQWLEPALWSEVHQVFSGFYSEQSKLAFQANLALYTRLARQLAHMCQLNYPQELEVGCLAVISNYNIT